MKINKKLLAGILALVISESVLPGCKSAKPEPIAAPERAVSTTFPTEDSVKDEVPVIPIKDEKAGSGTQNEVDVDLTILSSTMVLAEVNNMMMHSEDYIGKTIRARGLFLAYYHQVYQKFYPAVIIADATACCSQGLEFILKGDPPYPEAYPEDKERITVKGTFEVYEEEGSWFCHLVDAMIE